MSEIRNTTLDMSANSGNQSSMKREEHLSSGTGNEDACAPISLSSTLSIYKTIDSTQSLGPYKRFGLWVQGCPLRCVGCLAPDSQPAVGGELFRIEEISKRIVATPDIEGITISGGEPFAQAPALSILLGKLRSSRDLGVIIYTGSTLHRLRAEARSDPAVRQLLCLTDILIDGPYVDSLNDGAPLRGSSNQRVHQLTDRYSAVVETCYGSGIRHVELHMAENDVFLVGIPSVYALSKWKALVTGEGNEVDSSSLTPKVRAFVSSTSIAGGNR